MDNNVKTNAQTGVESAEYYDNRWASQDLKSDTSLGKYGQARIDFIINSIKFRRADTPIKILDLGCGNGWISNILSDIGEVIGVDFSSQTLEKASQKYGDKARFHLADPDYEHLGLGENTKFDVVVSSEVIEHVQDHEAFIQQINHFLVDDGICIITTPNRNVWDAYQHDERFKNSRQPIENWLTPSELHQIVASSGFSVDIHTGWTSPYYDYNFISKYLGKPKVIKLFEILRIKKLWGQLVLPYSIYQMLCAKKVNKNIT